MGTSRTNRLLLAAAFVLSVLLHVGAATLLIASPKPPVGFEDRLANTAESEVTPGIAASDAVTVSWIGFSDPTRHTAPEAETDQAQVSPDAGQAVRAVAQAAQQAAEEVRERVTPVLERGSVLAEALRDQAIVAARRLEAEQAAQRAAEARTAREAAEGDREALPDERDAAATSTAPDLTYRAGRPLARQGLQITTVRPEFDAATSVLDLRAARRDPVVAIAFARDGRVRSVTFLDGGTGLRSVDEPIKTAVYRWTAKGSDLEQIPEGDPDATLTVRIRFDL